MRANHARFSTLLLLTLLFSCLHARAQFSGVAPTSAPSLNVRQPLTTDPALLYPMDREMQILPGDLVRVSIFGTSPGYSDTERVSLDGTIRLNLAGVISLQGLSLKQSEAAIAKRFEEMEMYNNPQVSVEINDAPGHIATVIGEIHGNVPVVGRKRLYDVLALVGGLPTAASTVISIERPGYGAPIVVDVGNDPARSDAGNIPIFAGDTITVGRVGGYYVVGAVNRPGFNALSGSMPTTVLQAVALSGGATFAAKRDDARLVRFIGDQRSVIPVHLKQIGDGREPDVAMQTNDILLVPSSAIKNLLRSGTVFSTVALAISLSTVFR